MERIQRDILLKEKLIEQLEISKSEFDVMKQSYEEKFHLLQEAVAETQKERDEVLKKRTGNDKEDKVSGEA